MAAGTPSINKARVRKTVDDLGPLASRVVFIGGVAAELLQTRPILPKPRPTDDVDSVVGVTSSNDYQRFTEELRKRGFKEDASENSHVNRWISPNGIRFDVVPIDDTKFGYGNKWDSIALKTAIVYELDAETNINLVVAPVFLAMKWNAFDDRGDSDWMGSHDVEDILAVVAGRDTIVEELQAAPPEVGDYVADWSRQLLNELAANDIIEGALSTAPLLNETADLVRTRLEAMAEERR
jgi:predicted nucleotidyltransferase